MSLARTDHTNSPVIEKILTLTQCFLNNSIGSKSKWFNYIKASSSLFGLYLKDFLNDFIFASIDVYCLRDIPTLLNNKFHFLFGWSAIDLSVIIVDDTFDRLIITITGIICSSWNIMRFVFSSLLSSSWRFDPVQIFLIESAVIVYAMFPIIFFEVEVIAENVLSTDHFTLHPLSFIVASLNFILNTLG